MVEPVFHITFCVIRDCSRIAHFFLQPGIPQLLVCSAPDCKKQCTGKDQGEAGIKESSRIEWYCGGDWLAGRNVKYVYVRVCF